MSFIQYLKDTRGELHHVAWPTRTQTILYTVIVMAISVFVAFYLGLFDFIFTTGLSRILPYVEPTSAAQMPGLPNTSHWNNPATNATKKKAAQIRFSTAPPRRVGGIIAGPLHAPGRLR